MSLSVATLLKNHSRGIHSDIKHHEEQYFDMEIPRFDDITEEIEYKQELKDKLAKVRKTIKAEKDALEAEKQKEAQLLADKAKDTIEAAKTQTEPFGDSFE